MAWMWAFQALVMLPCIISLVTSFSPHLPSRALSVGERGSLIGLLASPDRDTSETFVEAVGTISSVHDPEAIRLKQQLFEVANATRRGFIATVSERDRAKKIIMELSRFNPSKEPASPYYAKDDEKKTASACPTLAGKWTLIYTDAPDITGLDTSRNPLAAAKLGRIGQECDPPYIKNVIEWLRPDWADPFQVLAGSKNSRILQKVCTEGKAVPDKPFLVNLKLVGIDLVGPGPKFDELDDIDSDGIDSDGDAKDNANLLDTIRKQGLPASLLSNNPLELRGPLAAPFGKFEILYVDEELRIIRTGQNYLAVNQRLEHEDEEWF